MQAKVGVILVMVLVMSMSAMAQDAMKQPDPNSIANGNTSAAKVILGILLYAVGPIVGAYGIIRGAATVIQRHEVDKGLASMAAGAAVGLTPHILNQFYGVDLAGKAAQLIQW